MVYYTITRIFLQINKLFSTLNRNFIFYEYFKISFPNQKHKNLLEKLIL